MSPGQFKITEQMGPYNSSLVCPNELKNCFDGGSIPYPNVSNTLIKDFLESDHFINTIITSHSINKESSSIEHHALRISSLIKVILKNTNMHPVTIYSNYEQTVIEIDDGHHRFRAYLYIKEFIDKSILMPVYISID